MKKTEPNLPFVWLNDLQARHARLERHRQKLVAEVQRALAELQKKYQWDEAYICGSVSKKNRFQSHSDVDIALSGLNKFDHYAFTGDISDLLNRDVDVIRLEDCDFSNSIKMRGIQCSPNKQVVVFLAEFDHQVKLIEGIFNSLNKKLGRTDNQIPSREIVESIGYWMHNLYCAHEDLFKLVSGFWENNLDVNGDFHINLLKRMLVDIEAVRPALIREKSYAFLNELRGFRHVFRHAYSYGLDDERVTFLLRKTIRERDTVLKDIATFRSKIQVLLEP
jgi:predicted nucleotidyltransferase